MTKFTKTEHLNGRVTLYGGDCIETMMDMEDNSIDSIVCDPPYHLTSIVKRFGGANSAPAQHGTDGAFARASRGFMNKSWDGVETPKLDAGLGHWLAGFADGEGCFTVRKSGKGFVCEFIIHIRADDAKILREVHAATEIGDVDGPSTRKDGGSPMVRWIVRRQTDCAKLIQIFRVFPLRAKKARDFEVWASAVEEWINHEPGTSWDDLRSHADLISAVKQYGSSLDASQIFHYRWARQAVRILKPGGHLVAFSGTRTYHRLAAAVEDAGFEIRDQLAWAYGTGFNKKGYILKDANDVPTGPWGGALKPAWEPICFARKPFNGSLLANFADNGLGALNIDACRIEAEVETGWCGSAGGTREAVCSPGSKEDDARPVNGRWPANIVHDGSDEVLAGFPDSKAGGNVSGTEPSAVTADVYGDFAGRVPFSGFADSGSAARFFYTAKADKLDRIGSKHPTVKPVDLMQWLCRMVTPPGGVVLDPFAGSGSTGEAAWREGFRCILIEREEEYQADIAERLRLANAGPATRKARAIKQVANDNLPLFGGVEATGGYAVKDAKSTGISQTKTDGGIMAGKGGFGFRIREHKERAA